MTPNSQQPPSDSPTTSSRTDFHGTGQPVSVSQENSNDNQQYWFEPTSPQGQFLADEFHEAWQHYRHCENDRSVTLGVMYTVVLAGMAWIGSTLASGWRVTTSTEPAFGCPTVTYFVTHVAAFLIGLTGIIAYLRISRTSIVQNHYYRIWIAIRKQIYRDKFGTVNSKFRTPDIVLSFPWFSGIFVMATRRKS